jgi:polysaccharide pyruvyl transferase WcaK-like protein
MHVVLLGSFSGANAGDSLVLAATIRLLDGATGGRARYTVPTSSPEFVERFLGDDRVRVIDIHPRRSLSYRFVNAGLLRAAKGADLVVSTAGIFFDHRLLDPRANFVLSLWPLVATARRAGAIVFGANVGVAAPTSKAGALVMRRALGNHHHFAVRDPESAGVARNLCPGLAVSVHADSVHSIVARKESQLMRPFLPARKRVGLSLAAYLDSHARGRMDPAAFERADLVPRISANLAQLCARFDLEPVFVATTPMDHRLHQAVARSMPGQVECAKLFEGTVRELTDAIDDLDYFIGARLHACIIATARGIPTIAAAYHPKVSSFMREAGLAEWTLGTSALGSSALHDAFRNLVDRSADLPVRLVRENAKRAAAAETAFELLRPAAPLWQRRAH